jgi:hypothetical protein
VGKEQGVACVAYCRAQGRLLFGLVDGCGKAASSTQDCRRSAGRRRVEGNGGGETPERDAWLSF